MFHVRDGLYFERSTESGHVRIVVRKSAHEDAGLLAEFQLGASDWASVVATVSAAGESAATHQAAFAFHEHAGEHVVG